jgi:hypothetical protein
MRLTNRLIPFACTLSVAALTTLALARSPHHSACVTVFPAIATPDGGAAAEDPEEGIRYLEARREQKRAIDCDLAEGRATLWEAAARLRTLDHEMPPLKTRGPIRPWLDHPVPEDERCCLDVLRSAHINFDDAPGCGERLKAWDVELKTALAHGGVHLPA